ncbi:MAG: DUF2934 domain-containing protein [Verrucomicrobia bacterium]|nr:DUF2934 domain-containing protein [Verrucomicrobiota bacterium]
MEQPDHEPSGPTDEEIALCAYRIWLQQGCPHGRDREHWLKAREQLVAGNAKANPAAAPGTKVRAHGVSGTP